MYQVVCHARTGSTFLCGSIDRYNKKHNNDIPSIYEFLNQTSRLIDNDEIVLRPDATIANAMNGSWNDLLDKLDFLIRQKEKGKHYSIKIIPYPIFCKAPNKDEWERVEKMLLNYLSGYNILTIKRDPYDTFLSYIYQANVDWLEPHGYKKSSVESLKVEKRYFAGFFKSFIINQNFMKKLNFYKTFDFDVFEYEILDYFNLEFKDETFQKLKNGLSNEIDYESLLSEEDIMFINGFMSKNYMKFYWT